MNITSSLGGEAQQLLVMPPPKYTDQLLELGLGASTRARIRASTRASTRACIRASTRASIRASTRARIRARANC